MKKFGTKQIMPLVILAICAVFIANGLKKFGFWDPSKGPTAAFVPTIVCTLMALLCVVDFIKSLKDTSVVKYHKDEFLMILTGIVLIAATHFIGMLPTMAIFVVLWLKLLEKAPWKDTLIILAIVMAIVIGVFVVWLKVQFPEGLIFEMLF